MAIPRNPLDIYSTYTYHFELYATEHDRDSNISVDKRTNLIKDMNGVKDFGTERDKPSKQCPSLLINTRYDAHQVIDNLKISTQSCAGGTDINYFMPNGAISFTIEEPRGMFFLEKLKNLQKELKIPSTSLLLFGLKIVFVGRTPDNEVHVLDEIVPMLFKMLSTSAKITEKGTVYDFRGTDETLGLVQHYVKPNNPSTINNNIVDAMSVGGKTLSDVLSDLENKLNNVSTKTIKNQTTSIGLKRYVITLDPKLNGNFKTTNSNTTAAGEDYKLYFKSGSFIGPMIYDIMSHSDDINKKIHDAKNNIFRDDSFLFYIIPSYKTEGNQEIYQFDVKLYDGKETDLFVFDYYFSPSGTNVDIINFDISMPNFGSQWIYNGAEKTSVYHTNKNSDLPAYDSKYTVENIITKDVSKESDPPTPDRINSKKDNSNSMPFKVDIPSSIPVENIENFSKAKTVVADAFGMSGANLVVKIRGHYSMLAHNFTRDRQSSFSDLLGVFIKLRIYNEDGNPFYYNDAKYKLNKIDSYFSGGQFTQDLHIVELASVLNGTAS